MNDNAVSTNYFNTVYNMKHNENNKSINSNLNESKELKEINSRLGYYINAVKDLTQYFKLNNSNTANQLWSSSIPNNNSLIVSIKNLEKDLESLKQLYDEEIKLMKFEIEELSIVKNNYSLENFNLELKLKDFITKFEEIKKNNEELANELNEVKSRNNRLEFELENSKLESEKPLRENKQLKKDLEDLINKLNEKQEISDNEIAYRQDLELKLKELRESFVFEKKISEQELENSKSQFKVFQETISELEKKLADCRNREIRFNDTFNELRLENNQLKSQNQQLEEQNGSLKNMCKNLELVIANLENMKKTLEEKIANNERSRNQSSLSSEINSIKSKLEAEEIRLLELVSKNQLDANIDDSRNENLGFVSQRSAMNKSRQSVPFGQITNLQNQNKQASMSNKPYLPNVKSSEQILSRLQIDNDYSSQRRQSINEIENSFYSKQIIPGDMSSQNTQYLTSYTMPSPLAYQQSAFSSPNLIDINLNKIKTNESIKAKDITTDLFNRLEKNTLLNNKRETSSVSTIDNTTVTEASYVGNVKIHEVNKNGYYVRLLNISNVYEEDLSNYTIQQMVSTMPVAVYRLPSSTKLPPGHTITVWARTDEVEQQPPHTFVWYEQDKWGTGPECTTILAKPNGQAVSWTTGCHKYGNIALKDYDEIVPVYSHKKCKTPVQLDRQKLITQKVFTPTKHPHGSSKFSTENNDSNTGFQKSFFSNQKSRPINSANSNKSNQRPQSGLSISSAKCSSFNNNSETDTIYQENISYFQKTNQSPMFMTKIK